MNRRVYTEFQILSGKAIMGDLSPSEKERLGQLTANHPELAEELDSLLGMDDLLSDFSLSDITIEENEPETDSPEVPSPPWGSIVRFFRRPSVVYSATPSFPGGPFYKKPSVVYTMAAGFLFFLLAGILFQLGESEVGSGLVLQHSDRCQVSGEMETTGELPLYRELELAGGGCLLENLHPTDSHIRLRPGRHTGIRLDRQEGELLVVLVRGSLALELEKKAGGQGVRVISGENATRLLGTKILLSYVDSTSRLEVVEGKVEVTRSRKNLFYGLSPEKTRQLESEKTRLENEKSEPVVLEKGEGIQVSDPPRTGETDDPDQISSPDGDEPGVTIERYRLGASELKARDQIFDRIGEPAKDGIPPAEESILPPRKVQPEPPTRSPVTRSRSPDPSTQVPDSYGFRQTLKLKDGRSFTGVLKDNGGTYTLYTNQGARTFQKTDVESIGFASES